MSPDPSRRAVANTVFGAVAVCLLVACSLASARAFGLATALDLRLGWNLGGWRSLTTPRTWEGPRRAKVVVVEFGDFQCPYCRTIEPRLAEVRRRHAANLALVYRHFPLSGTHPFAWRAAIAAECAALQGRFSEYRRALFEHPEMVTSVAWTRVAVLTGVRDTVRFNRCVVTEATAEGVRDDMRAAARIGVVATPTLLINGVRLDGAASQELLDSLVRVGLGRH